MKKIRIAAIITALVLLFTGCSIAGTETDTSLTSEETEAKVQAEVKEDVFSDFDLIDEWDKTAATVTLGESSKVSGNGAEVTDSGILINRAGTYVLSGTLKDKNITVDCGSSDNVQLVLNGVDITSTESAICVMNADKVVITLAEGTENTLTDGESRDEDADDDACIYSKDDLTFNGKGSLTVNGKYNNAIETNNDLKIVDGTFIISAVNDALKGKDSIAVKDGSITVTECDKALKTSTDDEEGKGYIYIENGSFDLTSSDDAIDAETDLTIIDGSFKVKSAGGSADVEIKSEDMGGFGERGFNREPMTDENGETVTMPEMPEGGFEGKGFDREQMTDENGERLTRPDRGDGNRDMQPPEGETPTGFEPGDGNEPSGFTPPDVTPMENGAEKSSESSTDTNSSESSDGKGLKAGGTITIISGKFDIDSANDALHSDGDITISNGSFSIASGDDAIHAEKVLTVEDGTIEIAKSYEGLEAENINIKGGNISITAVDDGVNVAGGTDTEGFVFKEGSGGDLTIEGGYIFVNASGDGLDSNGNIVMSGGTVLVYGPTQSMNGALDYAGKFTLTGGTVLACGARGMAQNISDSQLAQLEISSESKSGEAFSLCDSSGNILFSFTSDKSFESIVFASDSLKSGETYTVYKGGETKAETVNGCTFEGTLTGGTESGTVTAK